MPIAQTTQLPGLVTPGEGLHFEGSHIQINSNKDAPWQAGFSGRLGLKNFQNMVLTLIHELGHVADIKTSDNTVKIVLDDKDPTGEIGAKNNQLVYDNCFAPPKAAD